MVVFVLQNANQKTRGTLCNFLYHISDNVYVGNITSRVRQHLIQDLLEKEHADAYVIYPFPNLQGFKTVTIGKVEPLMNNNVFLARHRK